MSDKVTIFPGVTRLNVAPDRVLAKIPELESVVIAGWTKDGEEYFASSLADGGEALWLLERCKLALLSHGDPDDG